MARKLKTRIHFNRINMQRKDSRVWSAHTSKSCNMSEKIVVMHNGVKILETVFNPSGRQPRAYLETQADVRNENGITIVEV
jgi:hypothetical protein